jgi:hypothetical protein
MSDQFAGLIQVMAAAIDFCAVKTGQGVTLPSRRSGNHWNLVWGHIQKFRRICTFCYWFRQRYLPVSPLF